MDALTFVARRGWGLVAVTALIAGLSSPVWAQSPLPEVEPPRGGMQDGDEPAVPQDPRDGEGWDGAGEEPGAEADAGTDRRRTLGRRRPRLRVVPRGPDIRLEFDLAPQLDGLSGDGHDALGLDYDDLFSTGTGFGVRAALPMRLHRTASRISLFAGPVLTIDGAVFEGGSYSLPNNDVLIPDDMVVTRIGIGGMFRADFGRYFIEPWFSLGGGHVSKTDAILDQTFNAGGLVPVELYQRSTVGFIMGGVRGGVTFWPSDAIAILLYGEVGGWAAAAPDAGQLSALGNAKPGAMAGFRGAFGVAISFGLGDFQGLGRATAARELAPARRPVRDF